MTTTGLTVEDIAELRKQGDFREFLRMHLTASRPPAAPAVGAPPVERDPGHRPGAWPTGTRPPEPTRIGTSEEWAHAAVAYRQWLAAGSPPGDFTCHCGCTPGGSR
jgi:hypothetical protein